MEKLRKLNAVIQLYIIKALLYISMRLSASRTLAFVSNKQGYSYIYDLIGLVVTLIFGVYMIPIVVDAVQTTNTTGWTFTGAEGAKAMYLLIPFIFIIGLVIYFVTALIVKAKSGGD